MCGNIELNCKQEYASAVWLNFAWIFPLVLTRTDNHTLSLSEYYGDAVAVHVAGHRAEEVQHAGGALLQGADER